MDARTISRRSLLKSALAGPLIVQSGVLGLGRAHAANDRVAMACVGLGGQGTHNMRAFLSDERVEVVAVCDVDRAHRERARKIAGLDPSAAFVDYREIIGWDDVDAVSIGTPDHWHALITVEAARAGKDIFCEKPLSLTVAEGRLMSDTVRQRERVLQTGTWRRSVAACRKACEFVRNGRVGELKTIHVAVPEGYSVRGGDFEGSQPAMRVPDGFDYDRWLGPAPEAPYTAGRCHFNFRWILDYSSGYITDWGAHYYDVAQWGHGTDETGPVAIEGRATFPPKDWLYDASTWHRIEYTYADGVRLISETTDDGSRYGIRFEGSEGWIFVENAKIEASSPETIEDSLGPDAIRLYESENHHRDFVDAVYSRGETAAPVEVGHRSASICHLGHIATMLNRPLRWDPVAERFTGDDEANGMLDRAKRAPYRLEPVRV